MVQLRPNVGRRAQPTVLSRQQPTPETNSFTELAIGFDGLLKAQAQREAEQKAKRKANRENAHLSLLKTPGQDTNTLRANFGLNDIDYAMVVTSASASAVATNTSLDKDGNPHSWITNPSAAVASAQSRLAFGFDKTIVKGQYTEASADIISNPSFDTATAREILVSIASQNNEGKAPRIPDDKLAEIAAIHNINLETVYDRAELTPTPNQKLMLAKLDRKIVNNKELTPEELELYRTYSSPSNVASLLADKERVEVGNLVAMIEDGVPVPDEQIDALNISAGGKLTLRTANAQASNNFARAKVSEAQTAYTQALKEDASPENREAQLSIFNQVVRDIQPAIKTQTVRAAITAQAVDINNASQLADLNEANFRTLGLLAYRGFNGEEPIIDVLAKIDDIALPDADKAGIIQELKIAQSKLDVDDLIGRLGVFLPPSENSGTWGEGLASQGVTFWGDLPKGEQTALGNHIATVQSQKYILQNNDGSTEDPAKFFPTGGSPDAPNGLYQHDANGNIDLVIWSNTYFRQLLGVSTEQAGAYATQTLNHVKPGTWRGTSTALATQAAAAFGVVEVPGRVFTADEKKLAVEAIAGTGLFTADPLSAFEGYTKDNIERIFQHPTLVNLVASAPPEEREGLIKFVAFNLVDKIGIKGKLLGPGHTSANSADTIIATNYAGFADVDLSKVESVIKSPGVVQFLTESGPYIDSKGEIVQLEITQKDYEKLGSYVNDFTTVRRAILTIAQQTGIEPQALSEAAASYLSNNPSAKRTTTLKNPRAGSGASLKGLNISERKRVEESTLLPLLQGFATLPSFINFNKRHFNEGVIN